MFAPKYIKDAKMLLKGVNKFVHYKRDILPPEKLEEIEGLRTAFKEAIKSRDKDAVEAHSKKIKRVCENSLPAPSNPATRENVEVFFVAIVIALGIRAYFLQPFRIPTGSMQPTLNGIIATQTPETEKHPGLIGKAFHLFTKGRNYVDVIAEEDIEIERVYQKEFLKFFTITYVQPRGGDKPIKIWAPIAAFDKPRRPFGMLLRPQGDGSHVPIKRTYKKGEVIARGYIDTGDQVLVDKISYHFRRPKRGEVFVFTTRDIRGIRMVDPRMGSQHYIKRLAGVPGDKLEIRPPELWIDGEKATEPGFVKVMSMENGYGGYVLFRNGMNLNSVELGKKKYFALGDNSAHSSDSRAWGEVPENNLVGPALFVYWPFTSHWGRIR
ncbi:MAG: signal peptidase I [Verrucomicrobiota bacterium]